MTKLISNVSIDEKKTKIEKDLLLFDKFVKI